MGLRLTDELDCLRGISTENTTKADSPCPLQQQLFPVQVDFLSILGAHERTVGALVGQDKFAMAEFNAEVYAGGKLVRNNEIILWPATYGDNPSILIELNFAVVKA
jgi:hypothetical protein